MGLFIAIAAFLILALVIILLIIVGTLWLLMGCPTQEKYEKSEATYAAKYQQKEPS